GRLGLPRAAGLASLPGRPRRPPRRDRSRDPRPARAGAAAHGRALARRSGDGSSAAGGHARRRLARAFRDGRRGRARPAGADLRLRGGAAPRPLHCRRLAAAARRLPAEAQAVSFQSPLWLTGLVVVPVLAALYVLREHRRTDDAARFGNPALLPRLVDRAPAWRRWLPAVILLTALA